MSTRTLYSAAAALALLCGGAESFAETAASRDEIRAVVSEVIADAQTRSSLLEGGAGGGHDGKLFYLADASGNFRLNIGGLAQFRYSLNFRDDQDGGPNAAPNRGNDDFESGFQTRRTRLWFTGNIVKPELTYYIQSDFNRAGGTFDLLDAYVAYKFECGASLKWGQYKMPFMREELISDWKQLAAERSSVNTVFTQDRSQGIELGYKTDDIRLAVAFNDGFASRNSEFGSVNDEQGDFGFTKGGGESDYGVTGRLEWKVAGDWKQFDDFTSTPESGYACMLGAAAHIEGSANDIGVDDDGDGVLDDRGDTRLGAWTLDASVEGDGWNLFAAGVGYHTHTSLKDAGRESTDDYGLVVQGGFFLPDTDWELFARYDAIFQDSDRDLGDTDETFDTVTVGTNYYLAGSTARFTFDVQWFLDESTDLMTQNRGNNFLATTEENEVNFRLQFQLVF